MTHTADNTDRQETAMTDYPGVEDQTAHTWPALPALTDDEYRNGVTEERVQDPIGGTTTSSEEQA